MRRSIREKEEGGEVTVRDRKEERGGGEKEGKDEEEKEEEERENRDHKSPG